MDVIISGTKIVGYSKIRYRYRRCSTTTL